METHQPDARIQHAIFLILTLLLAVSILLTVHPFWDIWVPLIQVALAAILVMLTTFQVLRRQQMTIHPLGVVLVTLLAWSGFSLLISENFVAGRAQFFEIFCYIAAFWAASELTTDHLRRLLISALIALGVLTCLYGLYQRWYSFPLTIAYYQNLEGGAPIGLGRILSGRIFSTFQHVNTFAGFLIMLLPLTAAYLMQSRQVWGRIGFGLIMAMALLCLFYTKSVGGFLTLFFLAGIGIWIASQHLTARQQRILAGSLFTVLAIGLLVVVSSRHDSIFSLERGSSLSWRWDNWRIGLAIWRDHVWIGAGLGGYEARYATLMSDLSNETRYAHNLWIQLAAEQGLIGLLLGLGLVGYTVQTAFGRLRSFSLQTAVFLAVLAWFAHNLIDFDFYFSSISIPAFALLGLWMSFIGVGRQVSLIGGRRLALIGVSLVGALSSLVWVTFPTLANSQARTASARFDEGAISATKVHLHRAIELDPRNGEYYADLADVILNQKPLTRADLQKAVDLYEQALHRLPYNAGYHNRLGWLYVHSQKLQDADEHLQRAIQLAPQNLTFQQDYARFQAQYNP